MKTEITAVLVVFLWNQIQPENFLLNVAHSDIAIDNVIKSNSYESDSSTPKAKETEGVKGKKSSFGKILLWTLGVTAVGAVVYFTVIKKPNYTLRVTVGDGVEGTPAAADYPYKKGTTVNYDFRKKPGYVNLTVTLDGSPVAASGTITMDKNHTLNATALEIGNYVIIQLKVRYILKSYNTLQGTKTAAIRKPDGKTLIKLIGGYDFAIRPCPSFIDPTIDCSHGAILEEDFTVNVDLEVFSVIVEQHYGWVSCDYSVKPTLCDSFEFSILSYTWEQGKANPGSPQIKNLEGLILEPEKDFLLWNGHWYTCEKKTTLEFVKPSTPQAAQRVFVVSGGCR